MTMFAKRNQIRKLVGVAVTLQLIKSKWNNVMNIQGSPKFILCSSAKLTSMKIALACLSCLANPIWSVVKRMAANPRGIPTSCKVLRFPIAKALPIAKCHIFPCPRCSYDLSATGKARATLTFPSRMISSFNVNALPFTHTLTRAEIKFKGAICRRSVKFFGTKIARNISCFSRGLMSRFLAFVLIRHNRIHKNCLLKCQPFSGIGSEGYQALQMGRKFVGVELKQSYFKHAQRFLKESGRQPSLFGGVL